MIKHLKIMNKVWSMLLLRGLSHRWIRWLPKASRSTSLVVTNIHRLLIITTL